LRLILTSKVYEVVQETPLTHATNLSARLEANVLLKREDLQPVFSFKLRGAYNKMAHLSRDERWKGVVACSAGNHAQGVAFSARHLKIPATIVMPKGTPAIKHTNVSRLGGHVVLYGEDFDAAKEECARLSVAHSLTQIPPFDDPYVIAGQGTIGLEVLRQTNLSELEAIFCCVGGGGLIAGVGVYVKRIAPHVKIIGVETYDANAMVQSLKEGRRVVLKEVGLFADGAAVKTVGQETFRLCSEVVDDVIQVTTDETCAAIKDCFEDTRSILEPAGALALAGLKKYVAQNPADRRRKGLIAVASGANMNFDRLRFVAERAALGEKRESLLMCTIKEQSGAFLKLIAHINPLTVTEFRYRYVEGEDASILVGIELSASNREHELNALFKRLDSDAIPVVDLSDDELTKSHIRYLIGGRSNASNERIFSFEFPERGGALYKFLSILDPGFNISLFHYRNYGGDVGRVLAGLQCPPEDDQKLKNTLKTLGYPYKEETDSKVYKTFLKQKPFAPVSDDGSAVTPTSTATLTD
jgi:threonine dehydratase